MTDSPVIVAELLYRVTAPHFCAGFVCRGGTVAEAAPILKYLRGWVESRAVGYCRGKGWRCEGPDPGGTER